MTGPGPGGTRFHGLFEQFVDRGLASASALAGTPRHCGGFEEPMKSGTFSLWGVDKGFQVAYRRSRMPELVCVFRD